MKRLSLVSVLNLTCREASHLASEALDRELSRRERFALRFHTLLCHGCRRFVAQLRAMRDTFSTMPPPWSGEWRKHPAELSRERRQAIKRLLVQESRLDSQS